MQWVSFFYKNKELCSYDLKNTFPGEFDATRNFHAAELNCSIDEIEAFIVEKKKKTHKIIAERGCNLYVEPVPVEA